jgi:hypothetical protein
LIHKFEISQSQEDVTSAKELIAKTLLKSEGKELVKEELVKISSRITKNKTAQQITSLVGHLEVKFIRFLSFFFFFLLTV